MADARFFEGGKKCNFPLIFTGNDEGEGGIKEKITLVQERKKNIMQGKEEEEET